MERYTNIALGAVFSGLLCCATLFVNGDENTNAPVAIIPAHTSVPWTNSSSQAAPVGTNVPNNTNGTFDPEAFLKSTTPQVSRATQADDSSIDSLSQKADAGDAKSQTKLGHIYQAGKGVPKDPDQAVKLYQEAAAQGDAGGEWSLGSCYQIGLGVKQNAAEAVKWYRKAADQGDYVGASELSLCYSLGWGVTQDKAEAARWKQEEVKYCRFAADRGDAQAQSHLGSCYEYGDGVRKDLDESAKWYRKAADQGDPSAETALGNFYASGIIEKKDMTEAAKWYRKAADQGDADAAILLGVCYERGNGVEQDATEAEKWYDKGADTTARPATLAFSYLTGDGVEKDSVEAAVLYRVAADRGDAGAESMLGTFCLSGFGVEKDVVEAAKWFRKAAEQGDANSEWRLGLCYEKGTGVQKDPVESAKWYLRAAIQGNGFAEESLSLCYMTGIGVIKNEVEGLAWLYVSSAGGSQTAATEISSYEGYYSVPVIEAARRRATELQNQIASSAKPEQNGSTVAISQTVPAPNTPKASGSGAFISADGMVLTAAHVVQGATRIDVVTSTGAVAATVVKIDATNDVAVLKCAGNNFAPLPIASSKGARAGATVFTVGFPNIQLQGFDPKLTKGEISSQTGFQDDPREWQISVPTQPGNSGGPLCDENGNLIGIVEATLDPLTMAKVEGEIPQNVNYAVKSSYILPLLDDVQNLPAPVVPPSGTKFEDVVGNVQKSAVLILVY